MAKDRFFLEQKIGVTSESGNMWNPGKCFGLHTEYGLGWLRQFLPNYKGLDCINALG